MRMPTPVLILAGLVVLAGCAGGMRSVTVPVRGVAPLNPNAAKESVPVDVRIHPLSVDARFRAASVEQVWTDPKTALGPELLAAATSFTVFPGAAEDPQVVHKVEVPRGTRFVGVLAMYQGADAQDQRAVAVSVEEVEKYGLNFSGYSVTLAMPPAAPAPAAEPASAAAPVVPPSKP